MSTTELSVPSPRGLSRLRRNKNPANGSSNSLASSLSVSKDSDAGGDGGIRSSIDRVIDRAARRGSADDGDGGGGDGSSSSRRLSAMFSRVKKRRERGLARSESEQSADSPEGGPAPSGIPGNQSDVSLLDASGNSSLLTEDYSDNEGKPVRPTLSAHPSHQGYLTLSSPLLNAQADSERSDSIAALQGTTDEHPGTPGTNIPSIVEPGKTDPTASTESAPPDTLSAANLRSAFALNRKKPSDDVASVSSKGGGAGGVGDIPSRSRASSVDAQAASEPSTAREAQESSDHPLTPSAGPASRAEERSETPQRPQSQHIATKPTPSTPPSRPETPQTLVTPPTPTLSSPAKFSRPDDRPRSPSKASPDVPVADGPRRRRALSGGLPSRLSKSIPAPLTPTAEEAKTPGGTVTSPNTAGGFFSSVFSAAQKAADQLTHSVAATQRTQGTPQTLQTSSSLTGDIGLPTEGAADGPPPNDSQKPAVETLGRGELNLGHLGLSDAGRRSPMSSTIELPQQQQQESRHTESVIKAEEEAAARAVSVAYEKPVSSVISQATGDRPLSIASNDRLTLSGGEHSPSRAGGDADTLRRAGSVRSKLSGRARRHRGSSAAAAGSSLTGPKDSTVALPSTLGQGHRLTGFAVASKRRNKDFHQLFRSVPEDDYLIEDYSAALQRDILLHGRLYVSEGHICFSSNILGWVTNLVISFDEVVSVEKKSTAVIFPNAIVIQNLHARNTFASFVARDSTYELLIGIWKINHPNLRSSLNGVTIDNDGTGDKTEKADSYASDDASESMSEDEVYDEDAEGDASGSFMEPENTRSVAGSDVGDLPLTRQPSGNPVGSAVLVNSGMTKPIETADAALAASGPTTSDALGPDTHAPTECADSAEHYDRPLTDTTIPAPLGKVYSLMFGPASGAFMRKWLVEDQKSRELDLVDDKIGLDNDHKSMTVSYIKPLNAPVGPKQTKCITQSTLDSFNLEKAVSISCSTQTPDVPSGNVFAVKTKYCLMWGPGNSTRLIANCTIEWTGKSWLKGPIEKGAQDGQIQYVKDIVAALKAALTPKPVAKPALKKGKRRSKKEGHDEAAAVEDTATVVAEQQPNWGLFEPLRGPFGPVFALLRPFITSQVVIAVLFVLLAYTWILPPSHSAAGVGLHGYTAPERVAAYEEMWRREESELWDWLEDRVGLGDVYAAKLDGGAGGARQKSLASKNMGKRLEGERMSGRQMEEAIAVTEQRLAALKDAVDRKNPKQQQKQQKQQKQQPLGQ